MKLKEMIFIYIIRINNFPFLHSLNLAKCKIIYKIIQKESFKSFTESLNHRIIYRINDLENHSNHLQNHLHDFSN